MKGSAGIMGKPRPPTKLLQPGKRVHLKIKKNRIDLGPKFL